MDDHKARNGRLRPRGWALKDLPDGAPIVRARALESAPALSILMPCFREVSPNFLRLALNSLLLQGFNRIEVLALTDTLDALESNLLDHAGAPDPRLVQLTFAEPARLPAIYYGHGILQSQGGHVLLLPAPAVFRGEALQDLMDFVYRQPERGFYYCGDVTLSTRPIFFDHLLREDCWARAALLVPRELFAEVGLPDPQAGLAPYALWDLALRLMHQALGIRVEGMRPLIEQLGPAPRLPSDRPTRAVARRLMMLPRNARLRPEHWVLNDIDGMELPGLARDEKEVLEQQARCFYPSAPAAFRPRIYQPEEPSISLRVTVMATCSFLDTANVYVEQPLLEIARTRPLHYQLCTAQEAEEEDALEADVLLLSRTLFAGWERARDFARLRKELDRKTLFVMDDDLLDLPGDIVINETVPVRVRFESFLPFVDGLIVSSPALAERMLARYSRLPIHVLDNSCCVSHAPLQRRPVPFHPDRVRVALALTSSALPRLRAFADGLNRLPEDVRCAIELHAFGEIDAVRDRFPFPHRIFHRHRPYLDYLGLLAQLQPDVAWIPLPGDHDFYHCKTAIKYYEFSGLAIPGIYSRVSIYEQVVRHGVTGWLVKNTSEDWAEAITKLTRDVGLRQALAAAARDDVLRHHSVERSAEEWWSLLRRVAAAGRLQVA